MACLIFCIKHFPIHADSDPQNWKRRGMLVLDVHERHLRLTVPLTGSFQKCQGTEGNNLVKFYSLNTVNMIFRYEKDFDGCHFAA